MISCHAAQKEYAATHIVHNGICLGHQAGDCGRMHNFTVRALQTGPERPYVHLELVKAERADAVEQRIEVVLEPGPHLARSNALWRCRVRAERLLDVREVGHLPYTCAVWRGHHRE